MKIAVAGMGYVGLSNAVLLAQHNEVAAFDIMAEKVEMINNRRSPIMDREIENILRRKHWICMRQRMPGRRLKMRIL